MTRKILPLMLVLMLLSGMFTPLIPTMASLQPAEAADSTSRTSLAADPTSVTLVGTLQSEISSCGDWTPSCTETHLAYEGYGVWREQFYVPMGDYTYKMALNNNWDVAYPGSDRSINVTETVTVTFYYDHKTHAVLDTTQDAVAVAAGSFQSELGCSGDWQPECVNSLLTDVDDDGMYTLVSADIPPGAYEFKIAFNEAWGGDIPGSNVSFTVTNAGDIVTISWDSATDDVTVNVAALLPPIDLDLVRAPISHAVQDEVFYFVLPDRFYDGDATNNEGLFPGGTLTETGYLPTDKSFFHGGDIAGLEAQLDYIQNLGVTALWLTPVFVNRATQSDSGTDYGIGGAYHGYWIQDFENIDPHLGTEQEMVDFITAAQERGIKIYFDIVVNHTADYIAYAEGEYSYRNKENYPYRDADGVVFDDQDYVSTSTFPELDPTISFPYTPIFEDLAHTTIKNPAWLNNPIYYHNRGDSTFSGESNTYGDFFGLDDLFTEHPDVVLGFIDIFTNTITNYNIDGFRIDTVKHVNIEFWQEVIPAVMDYAVNNGKPDFFMFGEVFQYSTPYLSTYTTEGMLPSVLDFQMQGHAYGFAIKSEATNNLQTLFANDDYYTDIDSNAYQLANFIGNHDIGRFGAFMRNEGMTDDAEMVARSQLGHALMFFARGFPVVYYGDEQGFTGASNDKDARQDMLASQVAEYEDYPPFGTTATYADENFDPTHPLYQTLADYSSVLADHLALRRGAQIHRYGQESAGIYAFSRIERDEQIEYVVVLNNAATAASATFPVYTADHMFTSVYPLNSSEIITSTADKQLSVTLPAFGVAIYRAEQDRHICYLPLVLNNASATSTATHSAATGNVVRASSAAPDLDFYTPVADSNVHGRVEIGVTLSEDNIYTEVNFSIKIDDGDYEYIGTDANPPYRIFYDVSGIPDGTPITFQAIVNDLNGNYKNNVVSAVVAQPSPMDQFYAIVHYYRPDGDYGDFSSSDYNDFWGLHLWGSGLNPEEAPTWTEPKKFSAIGTDGAYVAIRIDDPNESVGIIVHRGDNKDPEPDRSFTPALTPEIWLVSGDTTVYTSRAEAMGATLVHYNRADDTYTDWGLHLWQDGDPALTDWPNREMPSSYDDFGAVYSITTNIYPTLALTRTLNLIVHNGAGTQEPERAYTPAENYEIWIKSADAEGWYAQKGAAINVATIHYHRCLGDYGDYTSTDFNDFWGLHTWVGASDPGWTTPRKADGQDTFGVYFDVPLNVGATELNYILHRGSAKDVPDDQTLNLSSKGYEIWIVEGNNGENLFSAGIQFTHPAIALNVAERVCAGLTIGDINRQRAYWLSENTIGWNPLQAADAVYLHAAPTGGLVLDSNGISGGTVYTLTRNGNIAGPIAAKFPHLTGIPAWEINATDLAAVPDLLKGQIAVSAFAGGVLVDATGLQIPGVLDDLYTYAGPLGVTYSSTTPSLSLWAPTARNVTLHVFADAATTTSITYTMTHDANYGVWSIEGDPSWNGQYFLYEVEVYIHSTGQVEHNMVTDPYAVSLSMNSTRSQIVDLNDPALTPAGWDTLVKPELVAPEDIVVYEIHVRDFSVNDTSVPEAIRGTFAAFTLTNTHGIEHLQALADAGLNHLHLLPVFDIATINEDKSQWQEPDWATLASYPPTSTMQQQLIAATGDQDGFNWGYDPLHYNVPEGSYSTVPTGTTRIVEFREMVQALNEMGLRVVVDVVYNHTNASGQHANSVLDRVVPGYYHRLNGIGQVETSTCCANTASEHNMMERLMVDSVVLWATQYKVDAFRFDLMGHHMKDNMLNVRAALDALTLAEDGVEGSQIYLYGEGWNFGEVADNARGVNATQFNMAGTGIGTFSDRLRDAVRGGGPFDGGNTLVSNQGFISGLFYDPNAMNSGSVAEKNRLLLTTDQIRVGLAGNLADYTFVDRTGATVTGAQVDYNGQPCGYTQDPQEHIVYISKHDNQTLYDIIQYKMPDGATMDERVRAQNVGLSIVTLSQGVPFLHAGSDMLRSKSMDRDSYNSGDWFNKLDFTYQHNNWGVGLPIAEKNFDNWYLIEPRLGNPALLPTHTDILSNVHHLQEMLAIRQSSPLFRLRTQQEVQDRLAFHNTGPTQIPGLIVMSLTDTTSPYGLPYDQIVVLFNATDEPVVFTEAALINAVLLLHPIQQASYDPVVRTANFDTNTGTFTIPARTTAVFVQEN